MTIYLRPVHYYETDRMDCVHHSNYIRWFEEARIHFMSENGFPYEGLEAAGVVSPVLSVEASYRSMCRFGDTVEIAVELAAYTGTRIAFSYTVRLSGDLKCFSYAAGSAAARAGTAVSLWKSPRPCCCPWTR